MPFGVQYFSLLAVSFRPHRALLRAPEWLDPATPLPDGPVLAEVLARLKTDSQTSSCVAPYRSIVEGWLEQDIQRRAIRQGLVRLHGFAGSYSSIYRFIRSLDDKLPRRLPLTWTSRPARPPRTTSAAGRCWWIRAPGRNKSWFFLMTLCWSQHQ